MNTLNTLPLTRFPSLSALSGLVHGVSTRQGGVSEGPFASLNLGWTVGDERAAVEANYRRLAEALALPRQHLTTTWQVHGNRVVRAHLEDRGTMLGQADGIITDVPNLPLTQRYADCTPVLVYDPKRQAVGLAHAGWRSTAGGVSVALVRAMIDSFGSDPGDLVAVIGPAIGPCCYEVGPEVEEAVVRAWQVGPSWLSRKGSAGPSNGRALLDLWEANRWQLAWAGVGSVEVAGICTRCRKDLYFSHRGDHGRTGRFAVVAMLKS